MRITLRRRLSALFILIGWTTAVFVCAIKPLAHCGPDTSGPASHQPAIPESHHHEADGHQHDEHHEHKASDDESGKDANCEDDPSCQAIFSALNTGSLAVLQLPCAALLYEVFNVSTIVTFDLPACQSASSNERVLLLTHKVCTSVNFFALAPPSA